MPRGTPTQNAYAYGPNTGEAAMVSERMGVGRGDECRQAAQEVERLEDQAGGTLGMWPGPAQMIEDAAVVTQDQAFLGKGRPQVVLLDFWAT